MAFIHMVKWKKHQEGSPEFVSADQVPQALEVVTTVGIAINQTADALILSQSFSEAEGKHAAVVVIPTSAIISNKFREDSQF